jgi:hypothetical protein
MLTKSMEIKAAHSKKWKNPIMKDLFKNIKEPIKCGQIQISLLSKDRLALVLSSRRLPGSELGK